MSGLNQKDIAILREYASNGNRELYWNYLAQKEGSDGYGLLALGVVRNDNLPGQVANAYAQLEAGDQHERNPNLQNRVLSEREWEDFGQTLLNRDLERREYHMGANRPDLALNLPGRDVQLAHDKAFVEHGLDPNCWTPRILLEATRKNLSEDAAENVWKEMLNNSHLGFARAWNTAGHAYDAMPWGQANAYVFKLGAYELSMAHQAMPTSDPNVIGVHSSYHVYDEKAGTWHHHTEGGIPMQERNARVLEGLNDAREVRLEREAKATQFHPDDPYREIKKSPLVVSNQEPELPGSEGRRMMAMEPGHPDYPLHQQIRQGVAALDEKHGRTPDATSENLTASLTLRARQEGIEHADHVVLSNATAEHPAGHNIFVVQGDLGDPAHLRAGMPTAEAAQTPVFESMEQLAIVGDQRELARQSEMQAMDVGPQTQSGPSMSMG